MIATGPDPGHGAAQREGVDGRDGVKMRFDAGVGGPVPRGRSLCARPTCAEQNQSQSSCREALHLLDRLKRQTARCSVW